MRSANCVTPNGSRSSSGLVRPRRTSSPASTPSSPAMPAERARRPGSRGVGVVARRDRRVGGEDGARADGLERVVGEPVALDSRRASSSAANAAWPSLRCTTPGSIAERVQRAHAADAEQQVLGQAQVAVADVQARGDPAVGDVVLRAVGVEQQQRDAADVDAPDLRDEVAVADRDGDRDRLAVVAGDERGGHAVRVGVDPVLVLPAARRRCAGGSSRGGTCRPTATSGSARSEASLRMSPASTPRPPE